MLDFHSHQISGIDGSKNAKSTNQMKKQLFTFAFILLGIASFAQSKYGATPEDSVTCVENLSLYGEFYKQKNYKDARGPWLKAITTCPTSSKNLYIKGSSMYKKFIAAEKDADKKLLLTDTLMWIYDQRIEHFGQKGYVLGRKGSDLFRYNRDKASEAHAILKESIALQGNKSERGAITSYYQTSEKLFKKGEMTQEELVLLFPDLSAIVTYNFEKAKDEKTKTKWADAAVLLEQIFAQYAGCTELVQIYAPKYEANPKDTNVLIQIIAFFSKSDCTDDALYLKAAMSLDEVKPSAISKFGIGRSLLKKERYTEAIDYFKEAATLSEISDGRVNNYKYIALTYLNLRQFSNAKTYALKMLNEDSKNADAYMIIGDAYLYGSQLVGENSCTKAGGYWAAISKYQSAKSLDPALAEKANKKIASAKAQYPKKEDCFFYNIIEGQAFHVGGWINEDVTVHTK
ncbi:MAG: tetratricopeptide repeat protein [Thiotrichaceae bacterium]|nr:tetratricopeptide repeat protein [Thiotrichaceae bacterium]